MPGVTSALLRALAAAIFLLQCNVAALAQETFVAWVASYRSMENARAGLQTLVAKDASLFSSLTPHIHQVDLGDKGIWFRLQFGPPRSRDRMARLCEQIKALGTSECKVVSPFAVGGKSGGHTGDLVLKPQNDGEHMTTIEPIEFVDSQGRGWSVPSGIKTDGASIPRALWSIVGSPFTGHYLKAPVIHDHYVRTKHRSWTDTHDVFYEAMIASGVGQKQALLMWAGVYRFGPRWARNESKCWGTCAGSSVLINIDVTMFPDFSESDFKTIKTRIETAAGSIDELKQFIEQEASTSSKAKIIGWTSRLSDDGRTKGVEFVSEHIDESWANFGTGWRHKDYFYKVVNVAPGDTLNVRSSPKNASEIILKLPRSARRLTLAGDCQDGWCPIVAGSTKGWVNGRYIVFDWELSPQQQ